MIGSKYVCVQSIKGYLGFFVEVGYDKDKDLYILRYEDGLTNVYKGVTKEELNKKYINSFDDFINYKHNLSKEIKPYVNIIQLKLDNAMVSKFCRKIIECKKEIDNLEKYFANSDSYSIKLGQLKKGIRRAKKVLYRYFKEDTDFVVDSLNTVDFNNCYYKMKELEQLNNKIMTVKKFFET